MERLRPVEKAAVHNTAILANTDILSLAITPTYSRNCVIFRIMVAMDAGGIFRATLTRATVTVTLDFNTGFFLIPDTIHTFDLLVHVYDTVNFQYSAAATLLALRVQEIGSSI